MSNSTDTRRPTPDRNMPPLRWWITALISAAIALVFVLLLNSCGQQTPASEKAPLAGTTNKHAASPFDNTNGMTTLEAAKSIVVVKDLGFGSQMPSLQEVMRDIERHYRPEDGSGRTFAILEAFTQPDLATSNLNLCLRVSTEKPGLAAITYRRPGQEPGQELWKCRITPATDKPQFTGGALTIYYDVGDGKTYTVDGSTNPSSILTATLKEPGVQIGQIWPEGEVREMTFVYSACGCPIKVKSRRAGDHTARIDATQLLFPDDPAAMQVINALMKW